MATRKTTAKKAARKATKSAAAKKSSTARKKPSDALRMALQDVVLRSPKAVTIEFHRPAKNLAIRDEDDPWSGNIYKYSF